MSHLETTLIAGYKTPNLQHWSDKYLVDTMGDRLLSVAVTPNGLGFGAQMAEDYSYRHFPDMLTLSPVAPTGSGTLSSHTTRK